jgi:hypothetical protein
MRERRNMERRRVRRKECDNRAKEMETEIQSKQMTPV